MPLKFKAGDAVKVIKSDPDGEVEVGSIGVVQGYNSYNQLYAIEFAPEYLSSGHDCDRMCKNGWYMPTECLEITTPPKPRTKVSFDSVVMSDEKRTQILEALEQVHQQDLIFDKWGFDETIEKGRGVALLFYGPPGTGKTLMGQAIADKQDIKLKVISTADIQSSGPGEAERNIRKHFKAAKEEKCVLLFDECDSLIFTRQHVGPILAAQINELLSQLERYDGITIFTTNRLGVLDEAVNRRLALKLEFSMPSREERVKIWQRMFSKKAPLDKDIDWYKLASIEITGGYIKNAVLRAARMAAVQKLPDKKKKITMEHLVKALAQETKSMIEFDKARQEHDNQFVYMPGKPPAPSLTQNIIGGLHE